MFYNCLYTLCAILLNEYLDNCNNLLKSGIICDIIINDPVLLNLWFLARPARDLLIGCAGFLSALAGAVFVGKPGVSRRRRED